MINRLLRNKLIVVFSLVLAVSFVLPATFTVAASEFLTVAVGQVDAQPGQAVTVSFVIESNPGISSLLLAINYDETRLSINSPASVRPGQTLLGFMYVGPDENTIRQNPFRAVWAGAFNNEYTGIVLNIEFTVLETAPSGLAVIGVEIEYASDVNIVPVPTRTVAGGINILTPGVTTPPTQTLPIDDTEVPGQTPPPGEVIEPTPVPTPPPDSTIPEQTPPPVSPEPTPPTQAPPINIVTPPTQNHPPIIVVPGSPPSQGVVATPVEPEYYFPSESEQQVDITTVEYGVGLGDANELEQRLLQRLGIQVGNPYNISPVFFVAYLVLEDSNEVIQKSMYDAEHGVMRLLGFDDDLYKVYINRVDFDDVSPNAWYFDAISLVAARRIFVGVGENTFAPDSPMTKAMFITALARLDDFNPAAYDASPFTDVSIDSWYGTSISWAFNAGIINDGILHGNQPGTFRPNDNITREQMAVIIANYLSANNFPLNPLEDVPVFADIDLAGYWAQDSIQAMRRYSIVSGVGNNLYNPSGESTRAEVAQIFSNLIAAILGLR